MQMADAWVALRASEERDISFPMKLVYYGLTLAKLKG